MKKTFFKNLFRDIKKSLSRFLSIVIIIAIGVAFYAGVRATSPDMKLSGDSYFIKNCFHLNYSLFTVIIKLYPNFFIFSNNKKLFLIYFFYVYKNMHLMIETI